MTLLQVQNLSVSYGNQRVLSDFSLTLNQGETVALIGSSGSGKTTAALALLGLLSPSARVDVRHATFEGIDLFPRHASPLLGHRIGCVFQDPRASLTPHIRVGDQIDEAFEVSGVPPADRRQKTVLLLDELGVPDARARSDAYPHELSGGLCQRVAIAMALAGMPACLVADEPTTALDVTVQIQVLKILRRMTEQRRVATLLISHDMGVVAALADRVIVLDHGSVVEEGTVSNVLESPRHPATQALLAHASIGGRQ